MTFWNIYGIAFQSMENKVLIYRFFNKYDLLKLMKLNVNIRKLCLLDFKKMYEKIISDLNSKLSEIKQVTFLIIEEIY